MSLENQIDVDEAVKTMSAELAADVLAMTPPNQQEFLRLMSFDSANMGGTDQSGIHPDHRQERSPYVGVYHNNGTNADKFKFRSALRMGSGEKAFWLGLGYFNDEAIAALAYNVAAMNKFGAGAWLNPVELSDVTDQVELAAWQTLRADYIASATAKLAELQAAGTEIKYSSLEDREAKAAEASSS